MSQEDKISHIPSLYYTTLQMDYLIICDDDPCAAKILKLFEVWSKDKDSAIEQAKYHNAAAQKEGLLPSHDESHWLYNTIPNLQRRLLFEYGEKTITKSLKLLRTKEFITVRNNPQYKWDRTKQYQFHTQVVQEAIYGITVEQITPYYAGFDPIKAETLAAIDTAKMRDANRLKCGMHDAKMRLQSGTKEGNEDAEVRDDPNSLSISYSNSSLTSPPTPQGELEQESGEGKPIESIAPEPSPTSSLLLQFQLSTLAQPTVSPEDSRSDASVHSDKDMQKKVSELPDGNIFVPGEMVAQSTQKLYYRDRIAEQFNRNTAKLDWEISPGVPYPAFVKWRAQHYVRQGGSWADAARTNAKAEIRNNPARAADLWEEFLEYSNTATDNALAHQSAGMTPTLPPCFDDRTPASKDELITKLQALSGVTQVALPQGVATSSCTATTDWMPLEASSVAGNAALSSAVETDVSEPKQKPTATEDTRREQGGTELEVPGTGTPLPLPEVSQPPAEFIAKIDELAARLSMRTNKSRSRDSEPANELEKYRSWLREPALRKEAIAWANRRGDIDLVKDEEGEVCDFEKCEVF